MNGNDSISDKLDKLFSIDINFYWFKFFLTANLQNYPQNINSKITHNLLKIKFLKVTETIQEVAISMQKKTGISWFKFSDKIRSLWMDQKLWKFSDEIFALSTPLNNYCFCFLRQP